MAMAGSDGREMLDSLLDRKKTQAGSISNSYDAARA